MTWLRNLKISTQLALLSLAITLMLCVLGGIGFYAFNFLSKASTTLVLASTLDSHARQGVYEWKNVLLRGSNPKDFETFHGMMHEEEEKATAQASELKDLCESLRFPITDLNKFIEGYQSVNHQYDAAILLLKTGSTPEAFQESAHKTDAMTRGIDRKVMELSMALSSEIAKAVDDKFGGLTVLFLIAMVVTILLTFIFVLTLGRSISRSIGILIDATNKLSSGDLRAKAPNLGGNEIGQLAASFNIMTDNLASLTASGRETNSKMIDTLQHLKQAVNTQVASASEQASSINETTSAIQQIKTSSTITLDKAKHLGESAEKTRQEGDRGLATLQQAVDGMRIIKDKVNNIAQTILGLSEHTQQIGETTAAVGSLAQQSKLLALNASIEAAKAGEAGKGFAVVAVEVKDLAEQSQQATSKVHKILQDIQHGTDKAVMATEEGIKVVEEGMELAQKTGQAVNSLIAVIKETVESTHQIMVALRQETGGIDQIAIAMEEINKATEQFSKTTHQTEDVMNQLTVLSEKIQNNIKFYKLNNPGE